MFNMRQFGGSTACVEFVVSHNGIRRLHLDEIFQRKVETNHYTVNLSDYIKFNTVGRHNTRHRTLDTHDRLNQAKYSYFNRAQKLLVVSNIVPYLLTLTLTNQETAIWIKLKLRHC